MLTRYYITYYYLRILD